MCVCICIWVTVSTFMSEKVYLKFRCGQILGYIKLKLYIINHDSCS